MSNSTQNDWAKKLSSLIDDTIENRHDYKGSLAVEDDILFERLNENLKPFVTTLLADARREVEVKCDECRNNPCYKCLDLKYGKWRNPVNKNDPAWIHTREATLREEES